MQVIRSKRSKLQGLLWDVARFVCRFRVMARPLLFLRREDNNVFLNWCIANSLGPACTL